MTISIIICTRNRKEVLFRLLKSIEEQTIVPDEVIIVDSSSIPMEKEEEYKCFIKETQLKILYLHTESGLTYQRNIGINNSKGEVLYFFDDDIVLKKNYFELTMEVYDQYPEYYGGSGLILECKDSVRKFKQKIIYLYNEIFFLSQSYGKGKIKKSGFPSHAYGLKKFSDTSVLSVGIASFKKEIFNEFRFDENVTGYSYMEDVDFSARISKKYKLFYNPRAEVNHLHVEGGRGNIFENRKMYLVNHRYFFFKNIYEGKFLNWICHWWSIIGIIIYNFIICRSLEGTKGCIAGIKEFSKRKGELLIGTIKGSK